jgi:hypothetical protein
MAFDISGARPKLLDLAFPKRTDRSIAMGRDVEGAARLDLRNRRRRLALALAKIAFEEG